MAGCLVTAACSTDRIAAPTAPSNQPSLALAPAAAISDILSAVEQTVTVGGRLSPLRHAVTATATIGSEGGRVSLPELGFELVVPRGAVSGATRFRVTALAGTTLSYEFE